MATQPLRVLILIGLITPAVTPGNTLADSRQLVELPPMMQDHMLANMRDHLRALGEITTALSHDQLDLAGEIAEQRLGMSSLNGHGAQRMAGHMPQPMQALGTRMHQAASRFALAAEETAVDGDNRRLYAGLSEVAASCNACHEGFRLR